MRTRRILYMLVLFITVFLTPSIANARSEVIVIKRNSEVTRSLQLSILDEVYGNVSVRNGKIDFFLRSPEQQVLFCYNQTTCTEFEFKATENGNYTFCFVNSISEELVTIIFSYAVKFVRNIGQGVNFGTSTGIARVVAPPPELDQPDIEPDDPYTQYLNFQRAYEILRIVREKWRYMPLREIISIFGFSLLALALPKIAKHTCHKHILLYPEHPSDEYKDLDDVVNLNTLQCSEPQA